MEMEMGKRREGRKEKAHTKKRQMFCTKLNYTRGSQGSEIEGRAQLDEGNEEEEATAEGRGKARRRRTGQEESQTWAAKGRKNATF